MTKPTTVHELRERLCRAQGRGDPIEALHQALIDLCDIMRPLGPDDRVVEVDVTPDLSGFAALAEQGRYLASIREDLIADGVNPIKLTVPLHPDDPTEADHG